MNSTLPRDQLVRSIHIPSVGPTADSQIFGIVLTSETSCQTDNRCCSSIFGCSWMADDGSMNARLLQSKGGWDPMIHLSPRERYVKLMPIIAPSEIWQPTPMRTGEDNGHPIVNLRTIVDKREEERRRRKRRKGQMGRTTTSGDGSEPRTSSHGNGADRKTRYQNGTGNAVSRSQYSRSTWPSGYVDWGARCGTAG